MQEPYMSHIALFGEAGFTQARFADYHADKNEVEFFTGLCRHFLARALGHLWRPIVCVYFWYNDFAGGL